MKPYILTENALTVFDDRVYSVHAEDSRFDRAIELLRNGDFEELLILMQPVRAIKQFVSQTGAIVLENDVLKYKGTELHNYAANKIVQMATQGLPFEPLVNFLERIMANPSYRARNELYGFLEYGDLPITPDGHFLAYKRVRHDYKDCHSGTYDNSVGQTVEMPRFDVDDDCNNTCSSGLHFCSIEYLKSFYGDHTMVVKIDPADVVSIPTDYNNTKGRCCRYQVVGEVDNVCQPTPFATPVVFDFDDPNDDEDDLDDNDDDDFSLGLHFDGNLPYYTD